MNRFFIFSTILLFSLFFVKYSFANNEGVSQEDLARQKESGSKINFFGRVLYDNITSKNYNSTNRKNEFINTEGRFDLAAKLIYDKKWFSYLNYRIQENPIQRSEIERRNSNPNGGGDKFYENHFGLTRELYFGYDDDKMGFYAGKFRANFGLAWGIGRGIWTQEMSGDYTQLERLGIGAKLKAGNEKTIGAYKLDFAAFTLDRKNLDNTQITTRDHTIKSDGAVSDTRSLDSYTVALDINFDFGREEKLLYRFAYTNLAVNSNVLSSRISPNKIADQKGYSATIKYKYPVSQKLNFDTLVEYVDMKNVGGNSDVSDRYFISSLITNFYKNFNLTLAYNENNHQQYSTNGVDRIFSEVSLGYSFLQNKLFDNLTFQIGHRSFREDTKVNIDRQNTYALMARYIKKF